MRGLGYTIGIMGAFVLVVVASVDWLADLRDHASALDAPGSVYGDLAVLVAIGWTLVALGKSSRLAVGPVKRAK
jgi:hypothetical protein